MKPEGKRLRGNLGINGRIILEWILWEIGWECVDWIRLAQVGTGEHGNELSGSIKRGKFLD
jgi:hypothetical protein